MDYVVFSIFFLLLLFHTFSKGIKLSEHLYIVGMVCGSAGCLMNFVESLPVLHKGSRNL